MHGLEHLIVACGPVTASTRGVLFTDRRGLPEAPVTMTLPLATSASPIASSDSSIALSMKPQVLTRRVGGLVAGRNLVATDAQLRQDSLRVDERLGTAEADETDAGDRVCQGGCTRAARAADSSGNAVPHQAARGLLVVSGYASACGLLVCYEAVRAQGWRARSLQGRIYGVLVAREQPPCTPDGAETALVENTRQARAATRARRRCRPCCRRTARRPGDRRASP